MELLAFIIVNERTTVHRQIEWQSNMLIDLPIALWMTQYHGNVKSHFSLFLTLRLADWLECSFTHFIFKPAFDKSDDKEPERGKECPQTCDKPSNTGLSVDYNTASNVYCLSTVEWTVETQRRFVLAAEVSDTSQKDPVVSHVLPPSQSDQNYNCCVTRRWSLCGKPRYRIWHILIAEGFTSFKVWME